MTYSELALAIFALLVTPGPTNTLVAMSAVEQGWFRTIRLVPAELLGYLATTIPLSIVGAHLLQAVPTAKAVVTVVAAFWVMWLALSMWRVPSMEMGRPTVTARRIAVTTLLNPKALIFGLVLLPASTMWTWVGAFVLFSAEVVAVAMLWAALGASLRQNSRFQTGMPDRWRRAASVWLAVLAMYLFGRAAGLS